jgi:hypothetical protein
MAGDDLKDARGGFMSFVWGGKGVSADFLVL